MNSKTKQLLANLSIAVFMGLIVGFLYLSFEWIVNNGSNWLWNDVVQSDSYRWRVIPLAIVMSILLSGTVLFFRNKRVVKPPLSLLDELDDVQKTSIKTIGIILVIGAVSLIGGASLGPEAPLVAACLGVAAWFSGRRNFLKKPLAFVFSISSIGALLAAFFNSLLPVIIPLLLLRQKGKLNKLSALIAILAGVSAWGVVRVLKNEAYIQLNVSGSFNLTNIALAALLGFLSIILAIGIKWVIRILFPVIEKADGRLPWVVSASLFGLGIGLLYFIGGQTVQFSGSEGLKLLGQNVLQYSAVSLLGLILVKVLATAWSTTSGYRGGLVFPSVYMGVCLSLAVSAAFGLSGSTEAGTVIGAVTGILMGMINPVVGIILAIAMFPLNLTLLIVGGVFGSFVALKLFSSVAPKES